ncbi:MAG: hypothetical protein RLZZ241_1152 [Bacteroidota bacterium]|jgi:hypothetical protein
MKRVLTFILSGVCLYGMAQTTQDVLNYSLEEVQGTARFQAMSGAFGALGGDLSALNINPAASAVFENNIFTITGGAYGRNNAAAISGLAATTTTSSSSDINQVGGVFVFRNTEGSGWQKLAFGINYDLVQNFDNQFRLIGSSSTGIDRYFLNYAQGVPLGPLRVQSNETVVDAYLNIGSDLGFADQQAFLGFQAGFIDPVNPDDDNNNAYFSNAQYTSVNQDLNQITSGYNSKFSMNISGQYNNSLYLGASINLHTVLFERLNYFNEGGYNPTSPIQSASLDTYLHTEGTAFSLNLGAIARVNNTLRLGVAYQTATWYNLLDDFSQRANTDFIDKNPNITNINFNVINYYEAYTVKTPAKVTGSMALIFGKSGLISLDYDYQDFSKSGLRPVSDGNFASENDYISRNLSGASTFRLGGEFRLKQLSLRGGYRYQQNPFLAGNWGDLQGYSGGMGYTFGPNRLDLAYSQTKQDIAEPLFDGGLNDAQLGRTRNYLTLSYTLNF